MMRPSDSTNTCSGKAHHRLHDVLDHHDGDAAIADGADDRHHVADLGGIEARPAPRRAAEAAARSPARGRARAACGRRRSGSRPAGRAASPSPTARATSPAAASASARARPRQMRADRDVLPHRQAGERLHDLEGAGDAAPGEPMRRHAGDVGAVIDDAAFARRQEAGDDREQAWSCRRRSARSAR